MEFVRGNLVYARPAAPRGGLLHATASPTGKSVEDEYRGTVNFVRNGAGGLGWDVTIGHDVLCEHAPDLSLWGYHARRASHVYMAAEFAKSAYGDQRITDGQIRAWCWWWVNRVLKRYPGTPLYLPTHAEIDQRGETGVYDGKVDIYPFGSRQAEDVRSRIKARLAMVGVG